MAIITATRAHSTLTSPFSDCSFILMNLNISIISSPLFFHLQILVQSNSPWRSLTNQQFVCSTSIPMIRIGSFRNILLCFFHLMLSLLETMKQTHHKLKVLHMVLWLVRSISFCDHYVRYEARSTFIILCKPLIILYCRVVVLLVLATYKKTNQYPAAS